MMVEVRSMSGFDTHRFRDRRRAGRLLAHELEEAHVLDPSHERVVVVGLARGGVMVAAEVAGALHAPLDALAVRKVGHPRQPEYGLGAVAPGGVELVRSSDGLTRQELADAVGVARRAAEALDTSLHARSPRLPIEGTTCVLVDDGLATGGTMLAAVRWARVSGARRIVVAVPVGAVSTVRALERDGDVDVVVCPVLPNELGAVGSWYEDFDQVTNEAVVEALAASRAEGALARSAGIPVEDVLLGADLALPDRPLGWVVFAHGSGSSRVSPRNRNVASVLHEARMATLLFDLLTSDEGLDRRNVFDVELLAHRLVAATRWLSELPEAKGLPVGYFGASTGAAAALVAAAELGGGIRAVVSRGGRPDLAWHALSEVRSPTLLLVGGEDQVVLDLNEAAAAQLTCPHELVVIPGATHLFEEPGALEQVAASAASWFTTHFETERRVPVRHGEGVS
jgi:putative phosphoribosyl transferase